MKFEWDMTSYCHLPKNLIFKVFKKIETSTTLDLLLIILKTAHDSDLKLFVEEDGCFKNYVQSIARFDSGVYFPNTPTQFMICNHSWWALHIVKKPGKHFMKTFSDVFYF